MKYIYHTLLIGMFFMVSLISPIVHGEGDLEKLKIDFDSTIHIDESLSIDISEKTSDYQQELGQENLSFEWDIPGKPTINGPILTEQFEEAGTKQVNLNVFAQIDGERTLINNSQLSVFVYEKSLPFIFSTTISEAKKQDFINLGKNSGLYIYEVLQVSEQNTYGKNILPRLSNYSAEEKGKSDYIGIWGEKEFLFSIISKINSEQEGIANQRNLKFLLVSPFNGTILEGYLGNLLTNKKYISDTIILSDTLTFQITKNPIELEGLKSQLTQNEYPFIQVDTQQGIKEYFFISRFINTLSNIGINTSDIYILIMIPFLLTLISFMKHFVGVSPIGITIPLFMSLLFYKIGISFTIVVLITLFFLNLAVSQGINKYNLLYTPKIGFLMCINLIGFFLMLEGSLRFGLITMELTDIVYVMLFIIISERLITIIISKEVREYRKNLFGTIFIGFLGYLLLQIPFLQILTLAYPEVILFLVPLNFMMGRFTGLRVTEYLRFKEIIKNIEEEE